MPVSAATEAKLRAAMVRLLAGEPLHTDRALTKENLARAARSATRAFTGLRRSWPSGTPRSPVRSFAPLGKSPVTRRSTIFAGN
jgi:hypothetical protein